MRTQEGCQTSSTGHSYNVRICHWINVVACAYLLWSGVHIFLDFPELYWGHTGYRGYPAAFRLADWGISWEEAGAFGDRRWGRNYHFTVAWVFLINGLVYVCWNLYSKHFRSRMLPARDEWTVAHVRRELRDHLPSRSRKRDLHGMYGTLQKTSYLILIFVFVPLMILTGIAQSPGFTAAMPWLLDMFGGRQTARTLHTIGTVALVLFVAVHVIEVGYSEERLAAQAQAIAKDASEYLARTGNPRTLQAALRPRVVRGTIIVGLYERAQ